MRTTRLLAPLLGIALGWALPAQATEKESWRVLSPVHEQTFVFGSETRRAWIRSGRHLALCLDFTNDPYVDADNPRRYDSFCFDFPSVRIGPDGRTFFYHPGDGRAIPVATEGANFLGVCEVILLPSAHVAIDEPHGFLSVRLDLNAPRS